MTKPPVDDLQQYRHGPFTVLGLMVVLALLGIAITWVLRHFWGL